VFVLWDAEVAPHLPAESKVVRLSMTSWCMAEWRYNSTHYEFQYWNHRIACCAVCYKLSMSGQILVPESVPGDRAPCACRMGGRVNLRAGVDGMEKGHTSASAEN
jgi:hypothetical protein